ncbi:alpha/beta fold hydrolase [Maricaulis salignorans]|uniref:Proline iminopeptidase n=1 Tax=Maricaulis salignorans TaxID=144026 RepID=A0A1G9T6Y6_9PROT|nr:alpha/beta fold hydrolase [Maricaulis salignorans]SDM43493.1 alpha/beta hydrolase fold [Maricaulis salignorans]
MMSWKQSILATALSAILLSPAVFAQSVPGANAYGEDAIEFTARSGDSVAAFHGTVLVPENRADPASRMIEVSYIRFPATGENPGSPIVYLSGGPGGSGSGTARGPRFPLFQEMRQHGDVIAFDQRGTGGSTELPRCVSSQPVSETQRVSDAEYAAAYRRAVEECGVFWREQGVDVTGYTTRESVQDLAALREHLGAEQISLWGISYGSHLALAALKEIPEQLDRVILASAEGLDQTVKMPAETDRYFARLQAAIDTQPAARALYPDVAGLMRRVHARFEAEPMLVQVPQEDGETRPFLLQRRNLQEFSSGLISDPQYAALLLMLYTELEAGHSTLAVLLLQRFWSMGEPITLSAMSTAMDLASGIDDERLAEFERQAETGLIGGYLNFPMPQIRGAWDGFDLGGEFRERPHGDTPVLLLTGTLDGRTYPDAQAASVSGLSHVEQIIVRNAGHNLFMTTPEVAAAMHRFMRGEAAASSEIIIDLPDMTANPLDQQG